MSAYLQMGHDTENLVGERDLCEFQGVILSPVNREPEQLRKNVSSFREKGEYDIIFDPQLYCPRGQREKLVQQPYFPDKFDTTDWSVAEGWADAVKDIAEFAEHLGVDGVASPVIIPRRWANPFYDVCVETSTMLAKAVPDTIRTMTTCIVSLDDLDNSSRANEIASIMTRHETAGFYLVLNTDTDPRRELADVEGLTNLMRLVNLLEKHAPVTVAYCSSDMILYKAAGATNCSSSKFFNLRRFTPSRFNEPPSGGGGQIAYWFEHSLLAFLREADVKRLQRYGFSKLVGDHYSGSQTGIELLAFLDKSPEEAWLAKSWRQYLSWFCKTEQALGANAISLARDWLRASEEHWRQLEDDEILMDEPRNDGSWIRPWRQSLRDFSRA